MGDTRGIQGLLKNSAIACPHREQTGWPWEAAAPACVVASFWTPANNKRLQALVQRNQLILRVEDAAQLLGTSPAIVRAELKKRNHEPLNGRGKLWTQDKLAKLKLLVNAQGTLIISRNKAATILGCDRSSLVQGLLQLDKREPQRFTLTPVNIARVRKLADHRGHLTLPIHDAARKLGCSEKVLKAALKKLGLRARPGFTWRSDKLTLLRSMLDKGGRLTLTHHVAARKLGCSARALQNRRALPAPRRWTPSIATVVTPTTKAPNGVQPLPAAETGAVVDDLAALFKIDAAGAERLLQRHPRFSRKSAADLRSKMEARADALSLPFDSIITAVKRKPNIVRLSPANLRDTCMRVAALLDVKPAAVAIAFIKSPALLQVKPETITANLTEAARLFVCERAHLASAFLSRPALLTMRPAFLAERLLKLGEILGYGHTQMLEKVLAYPYLLTFATETTAEKARMLVKLSQAVGRNDSPAEVLRLVPMAFSYSKERIAQRVELARTSKGPRSIGGLLHLTDKQAEELMSAR